MQLNWLIEVISSIILFAQFVFATPYSWGTHHSNYDASLDPIAWSRSFVKDAIRKPRLYRANALEYNSLDGGEDELRMPSHGGLGRFDKQRLSHGSFGTEYDNKWLMNPNALMHNGQRNNNKQKRLKGRKQKLNSRRRYVLV